MRDPYDLSYRVLELEDALHSLEVTLFQLNADLRAMSDEVRARERWLLVLLLLIMLEITALSVLWLRLGGV